MDVGGGIGGGLTYRQKIGRMASNYHQGLGHEVEFKYFDKSG
jgi:hypothetical protein